MHLALDAVGTPETARGDLPARPSPLGVPPQDVWAVVLAGGEGRRLRRFVRRILQNDRPKQFCRIIGTRSMLRHTWDRALGLVNPAQILTVLTGGQERYLEEEIPPGVPGRILVQPENRDTAPGLLLPLLWIRRRAPAATVVVMPADHFVWEERRFVAHIGAAAAVAARSPERLVLLGVEATGPDAGYGWIAPGTPLAGESGHELYTVRRFWEKPERETAMRLFARGHFWNTLVVAGRLDGFLRLAEQRLPELLRALGQVDPIPETPTDELRDVYRRIEPTNFSEALLARCPEALSLLAVRGVYWSDWGDPDRIFETLCRFNRRPAWWLSYVRARIERPAEW